MMKLLLEKKKIVFAIFTSASATISLAALALSIVTENWLTSKELLKSYPGENLVFLSQNFSGNIYILNNFGLWRSCTNLIDEEDQLLLAGGCQSISYKLVDAELLETAKPAENITETSYFPIQQEILTTTIIRNNQITKIFVLISLVLELIGNTTCFLGFCKGKKRYLIFVTGVLFVVAGMTLLAAVVLFMGSVVGEASHQYPVIKDEIPVFRYQYGPSFVLLTLAFLIDEVAGVLSVYLFIIRHKASVRRRHAQLAALRTKTNQIQRYFAQKKSIKSVSSLNFDELNKQQSTTIDRDASHMTDIMSIETHSNHRVSWKVKVTDIEDGAINVNTHRSTVNLEEKNQHTYDQRDIGKLTSLNEISDYDSLPKYPPPPPITILSNEATAGWSDVTKNRPFIYSPNGKTTSV